MLAYRLCLVCLVVHESPRFHDSSRVRVYQCAPVGAGNRAMIPHRLRRMSFTPQGSPRSCSRASTTATRAGQVHSPHTTCRTIVCARSASKMSGGSNECAHLCTSDEHWDSEKAVECQRTVGWTCWTCMTSARDRTRESDSIGVVSDLAPARLLFPWRLRRISTSSQA